MKEWLKYIKGDTVLMVWYMFINTIYFLFALGIGCGWWQSPTPPIPVIFLCTWFILSGLYVYLLAGDIK